MKLTAAMRTIAFLASAAPAATGTTPEAAAESAALAWLKLVNAGNYAVSWRSASSLFPQKVARFPAIASGRRSNQRLDRPVRPRSRNHMYPAAQAQR